MQKAFILMAALGAAGTLWGASPLVLETSRLRLALDPSAGGRVVAWADKARGVATNTLPFGVVAPAGPEFFTAWSRGALMAHPLDARTLRRRHTGEPTVWLGGALRDDVTWSLGIRPCADGVGLVGTTVLVNRGGAPLQFSTTERALAPYETRCLEQTWRPGRPSDTNAPAAMVVGGDVPAACTNALVQAQTACRAGDFAVALRHLDAACALDVPSPLARGLRAYVLRHLGRPATESARELRLAAACDPLDAWLVAERAFLEDDGEEAVKNLSEGRAKPAETLQRVIRVYEALGATREVEILRAQERAP